MGIDLSPALIAKARLQQKQEQLGITYVVADATSSCALEGERFDAVVSNFGLSDIDELDAALRTVARLLPSGGLFVFSILHPCFPGWGEDAPSSWPPGRGYYEEGWWLADNPGFRGKVGANHRTLTSYINSLVDHDLAIDRLAEPKPDDEWMQVRPGAAAVPVYFVARTRKA